MFRQEQELASRLKESSPVLGRKVLLDLDQKSLRTRYKHLLDELPRGVLERHPRSLVAARGGQPPHRKLRFSNSMSRFIVRSLYVCDQPLLDRRFRKIRDLRKRNIDLSGVRRGEQPREGSNYLRFIHTASIALKVLEG